MQVKVSTTRLDSRARTTHEQDHYWFYPSTILQARGVPRSNATAKDSEWVRTRQALEKDKPDDVNEVSLTPVTYES